MAVVKKILWSVFVALSGIFTAFFVEKGLKSIDPLKKNAGTDDAGNDAPPADETENTTATETPAEETPAEETSDKESE